MSFVQMFQFTTSDLDGIRRVDAEWRKATEGKRTVRREVIAADRNQPGRYFAIVFFDSYESAMEWPLWRSEPTSHAMVNSPGPRHRTTRPAC